MAARLKPCFYIAPIGEQGTDIRRRSDQVLKFIVRPTAKACGYTVTRADEISEPGIITSQVIQRIIEDPLVIAHWTQSKRHVRTLPQARNSKAGRSID